MLHWTSDDPTNANLYFLKELGNELPDITPEDLHDKFCNVITVEKMLPTSVKRLFQFPNLLIDNGAYRWSAAERSHRQTELCNSIQSGLLAVQSELRFRSSDANLSCERPATKGEEIVAAVRAYRDFHSSDNLSILRQAVYGTSLIRFMDRLDKWLARSRPSGNGRSIEYEIIDVLGDIQSRAGDCHCLPASRQFSVSQPILPA